jgi:2-polyprenyl-6-methoxyphenol hydroxylase-like FAD-dependent oxidoreductase
VGAWRFSAKPRSSRPHVAKGAIKACHDATELAAALADADIEDGLTRYDAVRRPASALVVARLGAYIEGKRKRAADPITFMRENGRRRDLKQGRRRLFFQLLTKAGFS